VKPKCNGVYHFHQSFPLAWRPAVQVGVARWNDFGYARVEVVDGDETDATCSFRVVSRASADYESLKSYAGGGDWNGVSDGHDEIIAFCPDNWSIGTDKFWQDGGIPMVEYVTMHELGHVFWLRHIDAPGAVMNPKELYPRTAYTPGDRAECERVGACQ
jgi:hypothetical protein